jgi:hypothetical protein
MQILSQMEFRYFFLKNIFIFFLFFMLKNEALEKVKKLQKDAEVLFHSPDES